MSLISEKCEVENFLSCHDNFLVDCDGVLWAGGEVIPGSMETIKWLLEKQRKKIIFITNNSTKSRLECVPKFAKFGLDISIDNIVTATYAAATYIKNTHPDVKKAFVIGSKGLQLELEEVGITVVDSSVCPAIEKEEDFAKLVVDPTIGAVVVGCDFGVNYSKIAYASLCLQLNKDCIFLATSRDAFDNLGDRRIPGMTASVSGIEASSQVSPTVVGKPSKWLANYVISKYCLSPSRTCMIGDRLDSDMLFGRNGKMSTLLVLTGCTSTEDFNKTDKNIPSYPEFVVNSLAVFLE